MMVTHVFFNHAAIIVRISMSVLLESLLLNEGVSTRTMSLPLRPINRVASIFSVVERNEAEARF